jgi:hypothetical protein
MHSLNSETCGVYGICYISLRLAGVSMNAIIDLFTTPSAYNDVLVFRTYTNLREGFTVGAHLPSGKFERRRCPYGMNFKL